MSHSLMTTVLLTAVANKWLNETPEVVRDIKRTNYSLVRLYRWTCPDSDFTWPNLLFNLQKMCMVIV